MRILFFTDVHLRAKTPARRIGNFEADVLNKLVYALVEAQRHGVDAIVCGSDLFDLANPSVRLASSLMRLIASSKIQWLHVLGNHDTFGHNPDAYDTGVLGFFATVYFGWLPLYLPELFPTRVRSTGTGVTFNFGRFATAVGVLGAGQLMLWFDGNYAMAGRVTCLVYFLGMLIIPFAPDTSKKQLED